MDTIKKISIKGYKSIRELDSLEFGAINVLIGANGSGKSNLISLFQFLNYAMTESLQTYIARNGFSDSFLFLGSKVTHNIHAELELATSKGINSYVFTLVPAAGDILIFSEESVQFHGNGYPTPIMASMDPGVKESGLVTQPNSNFDENQQRTVRAIVNQLSKKRVYQFHDTTPESRLRKASHVNDGDYLRDDGGNLGAVLFRLKNARPEYYRRIQLQLRRMIPGFLDFVLEPVGGHVLLRWRGPDRDYVFGPHQLSDGSLRLMALTTLFLQPAEELPDMIIVDEPELGLHPEAEVLLAGMIRTVSLQTQVLLATQSASFVDNFAPEDIIVCNVQDYASQFYRPDKDELGQWLQDYSLGDVWRKNVIGGKP